MLDRNPSPNTCIIVPTFLFPLTGSINAGLFLNQLDCNDDYEETDDGWICKTLLDWHRELFLSHSECKSARKELKKLGILEEKRFGLNPTLHYRINRERIKALTDELIENYARGIKPQKTQAIERIMSPNR